VSADVVLSHYNLHVANLHDGDFDPAVNAELNGPSGVAYDSAGNLYIADSVNYRIRKVAPVSSSKPLSRGEVAIPAPADTQEEHLARGEGAQQTNPDPARTEFNGKHFPGDDGDVEDPPCGKTGKNVSDPSPRHTLRYRRESLWV